MRMTGICLVWVEVPGKPGEPGTPGEEGPKDSGSGEACYWDPAKQGLSQPPAGPVPCESDSGYWSNTLNCYVRLMDPQPPAGDPAWQGHEPDDGAVYLCYQPQTGIVLYHWSANPPDRAGTGPTPRVVAQQAIASMDLKAVRIGIAPKADEDSIGIVGMPVWMWAKDPDATTVGPVSASASAGGITVTATASLLKVTWSMGDGTEVVCRTRGYAVQAGVRQAGVSGLRAHLSDVQRRSGRRQVHGHGDVLLGRLVVRGGTDRDHPAERAHPYGTGRGRRSAGARAVAGDET